jgi:aspartate/methionine/tyrosine aminotransferase
MESVQAPVIPIVGDLVRSTPGCISLGQGVVYYGPPPQALTAIRDIGDDPRNHLYGPVEGIGPLVEAIAAKLEKENRIREGRVVVTAGGNMGFLNAVLAVCDPGDEVILNSPYYFNHEMAVVMASARVVAVPTDDDYQLRPDALRAAITPRTRAVVTISPNNPTGAVYPEAALREVNALCARAGVYHVHDEAYEHFTYGPSPFSPGSIDGASAHTISLFSMSKSYGFAGWRIGYMVLPPHLFDAVRKIQDTNVICPAVISQRAALGALQAGPAYVRRMAEPIVRVRQVALRELGGLGPVCRFPRTEGAFYFLLRFDRPMKPLDLVERLVREHGVAAIPGDAFGLAGCTLRVAYGALEESAAAEGLGRLARGLRALLA